MSLEYIKELVNNKYDEIYNIENEEEKGKTLENFIYECLDKYDKNKVMYFIKKYFDIQIQYINDDLIEHRQIKICRHDDEFKKAVNELYKTCIICDIGDCHKSAYEVAHIWDFSKCNTLEEKYDVNNGILLCANMHKYFDSKCGLLKFEIVSNINNISNNTIICKLVFCDSISNSTYYKKYNGKHIKFNKKTIYYLEKKLNNIDTKYVI